MHVRNDTAECADGFDNDGILHGCFFAVLQRCMFLNLGRSGKTGALFQTERCCRIAGNGAETADQELQFFFHHQCLGGFIFGVETDNQETSVPVQCGAVNYDRFMGEASGAGVIFGNTGGVMEAALRTAYAYITGENPPSALIDLKPVRGYEGLREASLTINGLTVNVAVVYGTANARKLIELIKSGERSYHFVEVMTCPGGCIGGGGQPKDFAADANASRKARIESLYKRDASMTQRLSHENAEIKELYREFYGEPLSELAEQMLHTAYFDRSGDIDKTIVKEETQGVPKWRCTVCGYIHEGEMADDYLCPICKVPKTSFELIKEN